MGKVFKKPLHFWTVKEKQELQRLDKEGKTAKQIRRIMFTGDRSVNDRSVYAMMRTIRKDPSWVTHQPQYPGNKVPTSLSLAERRKKRGVRTYVKRTPSKRNHIRWEPSEKQIVLQNINGKPSEIKKKFFSKDRHITTARLSKLMQNTRKAIRENKISPTISPSLKTALAVSPQKGKQLSIDFTGRADELIQKFKIKTDVYKDEVKNLCDLVMMSNFSDKVKARMSESITKIADEEFRREQNELANSLKV